MRKAQTKVLTIILVIMIVIAGVVVLFNITNPLIKKQAESAKKEKMLKNMQMKSRNSLEINSHTGL